MARPTLPRFRADLVLTVELSATDEADAAARLEDLLDVATQRIAGTIRGARVGGSALVHVQALDPSAT